jgi:hypothetical protein
MNKKEKAPLAGGAERAAGTAKTHSKHFTPRAKPFQASKTLGAAFGRKRPAGRR